MYIHAVKNMARVAASRAVVRGFESLSGQTKDQKLIKLEFVTLPLSKHHYNVRVKTGWLGIMIICPSGATCLPAECCICELALTNIYKGVGLVQRGHHHHYDHNFIECNLLAMIKLTNCSFGNNDVPHNNDARFVFTSRYLQEGSCLIDVICVCLRIEVYNAYCIVFLFCFVCFRLVYAMLPVSLDCPF